MPCSDVSAARGGARGGRGGACQSEGVNWCSKPISVTGVEIWKGLYGEGKWWRRPLVVVMQLNSS